MEIVRIKHRGRPLITICVDQDRLHADLRTDERVRSRLRSVGTIHLDRYSHEELVDIVQYRVDHGLHSSRIDGPAVEEIADIAAGAYEYFDSENDGGTWSLFETALATPPHRLAVTRS